MVDSSRDWKKILPPIPHVILEQYVKEVSDPISETDFFLVRNPRYAGTSRDSVQAARLNKYRLLSQTFLPGSRM
jgi:hypothetical protein